MNIKHWMRQEDSGLVRSSLEIAVCEERLGHNVVIQEPSKDTPIYGQASLVPDLHCIHSQLNPRTYHDGKPKIMWMHGEPLSSVGNRISMRAIIDLATITDAFICMRRDEYPIWKSIKRQTYRVPKGVDLERFKPLDPAPEKLSGAPAVLYCENWRGERNPLYLCVAMEQVWNKYPEARLHLYNCQDPKMYQTFRSMCEHCHWHGFMRSLQGPANDVVELYNKADIVVSCLSPLYARGIEAFGCGKAFICPGYSENDYPYTCAMEPNSIAGAIIDCWENYDKIDYRKYAEQYHDAMEMTRQAIAIYEKYL